MRRLLCALLLSAGMSAMIIGCGDQAGQPAPSDAAGQRFIAVKADRPIADFGKAVIVESAPGASHADLEGSNTQG
ncbi:MAG: hypothetical protein DWI21_01670 [Planctomycetota bacterium]|nr:MAG: hypothetical protein DWI21_01670 [Planctomycetota bacterium]